MSPDTAHHMPPAAGQMNYCLPPTPSRTQRATRHLVDQFRRPHGALGRVAGHIMATRTSNVQRSEGTVDLLELEPEHRVLEVGFGPGVALERVARRVTGGEIVGVDHSTTMVEVAMKRNASTVLDGRMQLLEGQAENLPPSIGDFDRIFAINVWQFWGPTQEAVIAGLADRLRPGGVLAITIQPRQKGATNSDTVAAGHELIAQFEVVGLENRSVELIDLEPVAAVCVRGRA